jgi:holo-[acyl-carrier protein] synthase
MSVVGHGLDIIECSRVAEVMERHGDRFVERVLTPRERDYVDTKRDPVMHVAGRFAAKEAILKSIGTGWRGTVSWQDMEIINNTSGQPQVTLSGESARVAATLGIARILVSISHTPNYAAASAIAVSR